MAREDTQPRPKRTADPAPALAALRRLSQLKLVLGDNGEAKPKIIPLSNESADAFDEWRRDHLKEEVGGLLASCYGKSSGQVLRLSLIIEYLWWATMDPGTPEPEEISLAAVTGAAALMEDYLKPMAERVYGDASLPDRERRITTLARWVYKNRREVINARKDIEREGRLPGLRDSASIKAALDDLVEAGWLFPPDKPGGSGRPRVDYKTNSLIWVKSS